MPIVEQGKKLPDETFIKITGPQFEDKIVKNKILYVLNKYLYIRQPEEIEDIYKKIKTFAVMGLPVRDFELMVTEHMGTLFAIDQKFDSINQVMIEKDVSLVREMEITDPVSKRKYKRNVKASIADAISKIILGTDPFFENELYMCSVE